MNLKLFFFLLFFIPLRSIASNYYLGTTIEKTWLDNACNSDLNRCTDEGEGIGIVGGIDIYDWLTIESGYSYSGLYRTDKLKHEGINTITLSPKFSINLSDTVSLYGKFGAAWIQYDSKSNIDLLSGFGFQVKTTSPISFFVEYQTINNIYNNIDLNSVRAGINYRFGKRENVSPVVEAVENLGTENDIPVQEITIKPKLLATVKFGFDKEHMSVEQYNQLNDVLVFLEKYPESSVLLNGYSDSVGASHYNLELSKKRAMDVSHYLSQKGIDTSRLKPTGYGEILDSTSSSDYERRNNRKVDIVSEEFSYYTK
ncbi:OmpA family protein [Photobacterium damselae]|uniref:OmpA family protein n=1 Tax=Photobacterium damselae TaxID=38293 RepID=A0ABD6WZW5_PHODM|nr:OmpA family protein [Photobacterium damselae]OBU43066.1 hypothetical protein AYY27_18285 [Photobacterium damselae]PSU15434.1 OmpA family protein [Photobacterium damselae]